MDTTDWTFEDHMNWMRAHGERTRLLNRMKLNQICATMVYYDLPELRETYVMSPHLEVQNVVSALNDLKV